MPISSDWWRFCRSPRWPSGDLRRTPALKSLKPSERPGSHPVSPRRRHLIASRTRAPAPREKRPRGPRAVHGRTRRARCWPDPRTLQASKQPPRRPPSRCPFRTQGATQPPSALMPDDLHRELVPPACPGLAARTDRRTWSLQSAHTRWHRFGRAPKRPRSGSSGMSPKRSRAGGSPARRNRSLEGREGSKREAAGPAARPHNFAQGSGDREARRWRRDAGVGA
jgi:hypothetical protein